MKNIAPQGTDESFMLNFHTDRTLFHTLPYPCSPPFVFELKLFRGAFFMYNFGGYNEFVFLKGR